MHLPRNFERTINVRDYCENCQRTGVTPGWNKEDLVRICTPCGIGPVHKHIADYYTQAERVEEVFPLPLTNDNEGQHRYYVNRLAQARIKRKREYGQAFEAFGFFRHKPPLYKQRVTITRLLAPGQKFWDWDSVLRGSAKELIDALASLNWFFNDSPRWVVGVAGLQDDSLRKLGGGVRILIERAE